MDRNKNTCQKNINNRINTDFLYRPVDIKFYDKSSNICDQPFCLLTFYQVKYKG